MYCRRCIAVYIVPLLFVARVESLAPPYYGIDRPSLSYELPPLEYSFADLEPHIDAETVRIHYLGHHAKYTEKMNAALSEWRLKDKLAARVSIIDVLRNISNVPIKYRDALRNNGGGFVNHNIYWSVLAPNKLSKERKPVGQLYDDIVAEWKAFHIFKNEFSQEANNLFGSGRNEDETETLLIFALTIIYCDGCYVWLCRNYTTENKVGLSIVKTVNQDSPISLGLSPILVIDVWEHAYYLKNRNLRNEYVESWWRIVDWDAVTHLDNWWRGVKKHDEL